MKKPFLLVSLILFAWTSPVLGNRPNVILILTDDQGYGDIAVHGNPVLKTPHMDRLATQSIRFTDFHVAPMCSPTRGQLMTGIDAMRNGCTAVCQGRSMIGSGLPTMANYFADSGYSTGHFGKWHLGDSYPHRPQDRGFQETLHHRAWGITSLADHWGNRDNPYFDPILEHNGIDKKYDGYCTDIFFGEAMRWIEEQARTGKPFFCYLPTNTPHVPDICDAKYSNPYKGSHDGKPMPSEFYGMIANLDENLGRLEAFLDQQGLRDNTLLIYMSDNGTQSTRAKDIFNAGMREKKTSVYEGGHRVPLFIRWPNGEFQHDRDIQELTEVQDVLPTLIELCDLRVVDHSAGQTDESEPNHDAFISRQLDGLSLVGLLRGDVARLPDRKLVIQYRESGLPWDPAVVMWNQWRLLKPKKGRQRQSLDQPLELYHVGRDPSQAMNVATDHPDVVAIMSEHYDRWYQDAKPRFDRERWIHLGDEAANPMILYSQDWVGDYCDNPAGLAASTAEGYWNVDVRREGVYDIELRRWPRESNKALPEGWADGPGGLRRSARPIAAANLQIADGNYTLDTSLHDVGALFRVHLPIGRTQLKTRFLDNMDRSLCSAIYVYLRRVPDADGTKLAAQSDRKPLDRSTTTAKSSTEQTEPLPDDIVIADFEGETYGEWIASGMAFGTKPASGTLPRQMKVSGFKGKGLVNSFVGGDDSTGTLTSPPFEIQRPFLNFLIGGGNRAGRTCVNLIVDGQVVRSATGSNPGGNRTELLEPASWNVKDLLGQSATIQLIDRQEGGWGHITFDQLVQSKQTVATAVVPGSLKVFETKLTVDATHLIVPVANKGERLLMGIYQGDQLVQDFTVSLPKENSPHWLAAYPLEHFGVSGKEIRIAPVKRKKLPASYGEAFDLFKVGTPSDAWAIDDYALPYRDQLHVSVRRGWNNDPNGMVYHDGKYHLYFQHNPFGIRWGNMHWGHFESVDLIHWEQKPIALFQKTTSDMMFSGGGFVDVDNTAGLGRNALFVAFTSTGRGECLAYSNDGGATFRELEENPVVRHKGRDPKIIWYQPERKWVMTVYNSEPCAETESTPPRKGTPQNRVNNNITFWSSKDLRTWQRTGAFTHEDRDAVHECPELFELPIEGQPNDSRWILYGAQNRYFIGTFDGKTFHMDSGPHGDPRSPQKVGPSGGRGTMYAAQTFSDTPDGRRIQMGWLRTAPDLTSYPDQIVSQSMSLPHEFRLRETADGLRLFYQPIQELDELRAEMLTEDIDEIGAAEGELADIHIEFENTGRHDLIINGIDASFDGQSARIITDRNTNEVYIDGGVEYRTYRREPSQTGSTKTQIAGEDPMKSLRVFRLRSIWTDASAKTSTALLP
ncbi:MAG: sulfatase-like hydrolase/transferase [Planctomycetota bacterium]